MHPTCIWCHLVEYHQDLWHQQTKVLGYCVALNFGIELSFSFALTRKNLTLCCQLQ